MAFADQATNKAEQHDSATHERNANFDSFVASELNRRHPATDHLLNSKQQFSNRGARQKTQLVVGASQRHRMRLY